MRSLGLYEHYINNDEARRCVRYLIAMARAPCRRMAEAFQSIILYMQDRGVYDILYPLVDYVYRAWLVGIGAERLSVFGEYYTTDNGPETLHKMLNEQVPRAHPNMWAILGKHRPHST